MGSGGSGFRTYTQQQIIDFRKLASTSAEPVKNPSSVLGYEIDRDPVHKLIKITNKAIWFQFKRLPFNACNSHRSADVCTLWSVFFGPSVCPILYCNLTYPTISTRINYLRNSVDIPSLPAFILLSLFWCYVFGFFGRASPCYLYQSSIILFSNYY